MEPPCPPDPKPTLGIPVVGMGDAAETLLSCRVPDLLRSHHGESREGNTPTQNEDAPVAPGPTRLLWSA